MCWHVLLFSTPPQHHGRWRATCRSNQAIEQCRVDPVVTAAAVVQALIVAPIACWTQHRQACPDFLACWYLSHTDRLWPAVLGLSLPQAAVQSYESSCSMTDSSAGDDLPGLLHNWGVGLHTISKHAQARHTLLVSQNPEPYQYFSGSGATLQWLTPMCCAD